jgi:hypothetical protein
MVIPNYIYLKLKMSGPTGIITIGTTAQHAYKCEVQYCDLVKGVIVIQELPHVLQTVSSEAPDAKKQQEPLSTSRV